MLTKLNEFNYILMILVHEMKKLMGEKILAPILFLLGQPDDPKFEMYLVFNFIPLDDFKRVVTRNLQDLGRTEALNNLETIPVFFSRFFDKKISGKDVLYTYLEERTQYLWTSYTKGKEVAGQTSIKAVELKYNFGSDVKTAETGSSQRGFYDSFLKKIGFTAAQLESGEFGFRVMGNALQKLKVAESPILVRLADLKKNDKVLVF